MVYNYSLYIAVIPVIIDSMHVLYIYMYYACVMLFLYDTILYTMYYIYISYMCVIIIMYIYIFYMYVCVYYI